MFNDEDRDEADNTLTTKSNTVSALDLLGGAKTQNSTPPHIISVLLPAPRLPRRRREMLLPFLKRFGKTALALELTALGSFYYIFHDINTGGNEARIKWEQRGASFLIDALYKVTGDERVIAHRRGETGAEKKAD